jgi:hypothetical protein
MELKATVKKKQSVVSGCWKVVGSLRDQVLGTLQATHY